jgi:hypothetical protein
MDPSLRGWLVGLRSRCGEKGLDKQEAINETWEGETGNWWHVWQNDPTS